MCATWAAAHLRKKFPHFCARSVGKKVLLKATPVAKKEIRRPLINDMSRQQVECRVDVAKAFAVNQAILELSTGAFGLVEKSTEVLARCLPISRLVSAADHDVKAGTTRLAKVVAPSSDQSVQLLEFDAHGQLCNLEGMRGECAEVFLESVEIHNAFRESAVDECACAAQQLGRRLHRWCGGRVVRDRLRLPNLCALFVKLFRGELGQAAASVCHEGQLDAEREMGERLELVIASWYHLLALFAAVAQEPRFVADQNNHRDAVAELCQDLFDEPRVGFVESDVNGGKQPIMWWECSCFSELALRKRVRQLH